MSVTRIRLADVTGSDIERWHALAAAAEPNPFLEAEFVLAAAAALGAERVWLDVVRSGNDWNLCLPVHDVRHWHHVPVPGTVPWFHDYCFLGTPIVRAGVERAAVSELLDGFTESRTSSFMGLETVVADGSFRQALGEATSELGVHVTAIRQFERAALRRRPDGDYLQIKPKHRREFRRQRDRLAEQLGAPLETRDVSGDLGAVDQFLVLEASGWKGRSGTAFAAIEGHDDFFRRMCAAFADLGRLQMLELHADGQAVAMKCNIRAAEGSFCFKIAFDESWSRFSPGILLELDNIERFHADPSIKWMDSCASHTNAMINRLWPDRRSLETLVLTRGPRGLAARKTFEAARVARRAMKGNQ